MGNINITKNSSVRLGNIGQVRQAYAGDMSAAARGLAHLGQGIENVGRVAGNIAIDLKEREDATKVNDAMSKLMIGSSDIQNKIVADKDIRPGDWQGEYKTKYDELYGEVTKELNSAQMEKMSAAASRLYTSAMIGLGQGAMRRVVAEEKESAIRLCSAAKARAIDNPNEETIDFYVRAFTDASKDTVRQIHELESAGKTAEAAALREDLRIKQRQCVDEALGENALNSIRAAEMAGDEAKLEELAKLDWTKDPNTEAKYNKDTGRTGFGKNAAAALHTSASTALRRLRQRREETYREGAASVASDFQKSLESVRDTNTFLNPDSLPTAQEYAATIDAKVKNNELKEADARTFVKQFDDLLRHREHIRKAVDAGDGVWTTAKDRNGKTYQVFQPNRIGNGKAETDATYAAKYTLVGRDGKIPFQDNPEKGMEELDYDLRMGNISVNFYNAKMAKLRVFSDIKAKDAFIKIFGPNPVIFSEKDLTQMEQRGIQASEHQKVFAKNRLWSGIHRIGSQEVPWNADIYKKDNSEGRVTDQQEAELMDMILDATANGIDPTEAIHAYLAPTFAEWMQSDLENRLDPNYIVNGMSFRDRLISSERFAKDNTPAKREQRIQDKQKKTYESQN